MIIPVPVIRRKMIIRRFLKCGAISPQTAKTPEEAGVFRGMGLIFSKLEDRGVLKYCEGDKYYIDTAKL